MNIDKPDESPFHVVVLAFRVLSACGGVTSSAAEPGGGPPPMFPSAAGQGIQNCGSDTDLPPVTPEHTQGMDVLIVPGTLIPTKKWVNSWASFALTIQLRGATIIDFNVKKFTIRFLESQPVLER